MTRKNPLRLHLPYLPMMVVCICAYMLTITGIGMAPSTGPLVGASWIWHPEMLREPDSRVYLTRSFDLVQPIERATILCTADDEYVLYVNGHETGRSPGPGSCGEWWKRLDLHNAAPFLKQGTNVICVEAHNLSRSAGFIASLRAELRGGATITLSTDRRWIASATPPADWPRISAVPHGQPAAELGRPPVKPWGTPAPPTKLGRIAADLEVPIRREFALPTDVFTINGRMSSIIDIRQLLKRDGHAAVIYAPPGKQVSFVLDFGRETVGYFRAETSGGQAVINLAYGESLQECLQPRPFQPIDHRVVSPGTWTWIDTERRAFRYVKVSITDCSEPLRIDHLGADLVSYPVEYRGSFRCSDEALNRIWEVGRYTTRLTMQDYFEDGVK